MKISIKYIRAIIAMVSLALVSCQEKLPQSVVTPYPTDLISIKIINAGANGSTVLDGIIDEYNKSIDFPRLDVESNFSEIKVEAELSEGATLESYTFDFSMEDEVSNKTLILRVKNQNRYKDYFIKVRKRIPVFGADFQKPTVYNFSGDNVYPDFASLLTRSASFDGEHVLVVSRKSGPHLLKFSDLKENNIAPIKLDITGVSGGTFAYNMGAIVNGKVYIASLSGSKASPLKIYYWDTPNSAPENIANINVGSIPDAGNRHGDNISVSIDKSGNGYIFFGDNASTAILRLRVTNYKTIDNPTVLKSSSSATAFSNIFRIEDSDDYLWSGVRLPITLTDVSASPRYAMNAANIPKESIAAKMFTFNSERYLISCTAGFGSASTATPALSVHNVTLGSNPEEALKRYDSGENHTPDYSFILGGQGNGAPSAQTDYFIEKDENGKDSKLYIFAARSDSGFVICEFPIKQEED